MTGRSPSRSAASGAGLSPGACVVSTWSACHSRLAASTDPGSYVFVTTSATCTDGNRIRLGVPELTEERRRELVKVVRSLAEDGRVAIRNIRRDVMHDLRELKDAGEAGADDEKRAEEALQKATDEKVAELDALLKAKEADILEV